MKNHILWQHQKWTVHTDWRKYKQPCNWENKLLHCVGKNNNFSGVLPSSTTKYDHKVIVCLNVEEPKLEGHKWSYSRGTIKVAFLIHRRAKLRDQSLAWFMFKYICLLHSGTNNKESLITMIFITIMSNNIQ